ncbi:helix-turn-helix domain-containing protein (plasmid) [Cytobacillus firmus]|uniref:helix-turn-helix domain-containing protein n=1 Tax=Cytobacillus firmus TaxID=1399 RepID=UPI003850C0EC
MYIDKVKVGQNIRKIRKAKDMTLKELSSNICSITKLSNIENGIGEISLDDLEKFCIKLNISIHDLLPKSEKFFLDQSRVAFAKIEDFIRMGFHDIAESKIEKLVDDEMFLPLQINYLKALNNYETRNYHSAMYFLFEMIKEKHSIELEKELISKAFNLIGIIYNKLGDYTSAQEMFEKAINSSTNKQWTNLILYNLVVVFATKGQVIDARFKIGEINSSNFPYQQKIRYISTMLDVLEGDYNQSIEKIFELRNEFFQLKDFDSFLRTIIFFIYIYDKHPKILNNYLIEVESFILDMSEIKRLPENTNPILVASLLQTMTLHFLKQKDLIKADQYLKLAFDLAEKHPNESMNAITYYLAAIIHNQSESDKETQLVYLKKALKQIEFGQPSVLKGLILYELAKIEEIKDSYWKQAADNFFDSMLINNYFNHINLSMLMPQMLY